MTQMQNQDQAPQAAQPQQPANGPAGFTATPSMTKVADFSDYGQAQAAVDLLSDSGFEVGATRIVGHDLKSVEIVRGRMN